MDTFNVNYCKTEGKVSKLIFGQFIEHWGRCINYDGICAEMLVNNKFEDVPGSNYYNTGLAFPWELSKFSWGTKYSIDKLIYMYGNSSQLIELSNRNHCYYGVCQKVYIETDKKYRVRVLLKTNTIGMKIKISFSNKVETVTYASCIVTLQTSQWEMHEVELTANAYDREAKFMISTADTGRLWINYVSLVPSDNIFMSRRDLVDVIKEIRPTIIRWPGGWFADHYHWEDGIGPIEKRPTRVRRELAPIESNNFGTDEYIQFCKSVNAEPYINLNFGTGSIQEILNWVEYCNGASDTEYGSKRAKIHQDPYNVVYWCIGNEMYLKRTKAFYVEPEQYASEVVKISRLLKERYPYIKIIATGNSEIDSDWNRRVLEVCGSDIDMLSIHKFVGGNWVQEGLNADDDYQIVGEGIEKTQKEIENTINLIKNMELKNVKICMDEWNVWLPTNNYLEHDYSIREGIYTARMLHLFYKYSDMLMISAPAQLVNVMGIINTDGDKIITSPSYNVFKMQAGFAEYKVALVEKQQENDNMEYLDCVAMVSENGKESLSVINWSNESKRTVKISLESNNNISTARVLKLGKDNVIISESLEKIDSGILEYTFEPYTVYIFEFE